MIRGKSLLIKEKLNRPGERFILSAGRISPPKRDEEKRDRPGQMVKMTLSAELEFPKKKPKFLG